MSNEVVAVGAADNVDMSGPSDPEPYEVDVDERRVVKCYCCTCEEEATLYLDSGETGPWEHDEQHASHVVDYWREA